MSSTIFFFFFIPLLALILLALNLIFAPHNPYVEKNNVFECGFSSFLGQNRTQFSVSFFIFGILFLLFDLEVFLVYPYLVSAYTNDIYGLAIMLMFLLALTLGFAFELGKKALSIDSRQSYSVSSRNKAKAIYKVSYNVDPFSSPFFKIARRNYSSSSDIAINLIHDKLLSYSREIKLILIVCLLVTLSLWLISRCILGFTYFTSYINFILICLLGLVTKYYFYVSRESKTNASTSIKPYLNNGFVHDLAIYIDKYLLPVIALVWFTYLLISSILWLISLVMSPICYLYSALIGAILSYMIIWFTGTRYYIAIKRFCHEFIEICCKFIIICYINGPEFAFDLLAFYLCNWFALFIKNNIFNILFFSLFYIYTVDLNFIYCSFLLSVYLVILLFFAIIYTCMHRGLFRNKVVFWSLMGLLIILFLIASYYTYTSFMYILLPYSLLTKDNNNSNKSGDGSPKDPYREGPDGPRSPKGPKGPGENNSHCYPPQTGKRKRSNQIEDDETSITERSNQFEDNETSIPEKYEVTIKPNSDQLYYLKNERSADRKWLKKRELLDKQKKEGIAPNVNTKKRTRKSRPDETAEERSNRIRERRERSNQAKRNYRERKKKEKQEQATIFSIS